MLARYDPSKPTFIRTDRSAEGMVYILMKLANNQASVEATALLLKTDKCIFDNTKSGARLQIILFGSRCCTGIEK